MSIEVFGYLFRCKTIWMKSMN